MIIVDAHCDTITRLMEENAWLYSNSCHVDLDRMNKQGNYVQFFAAFIDPSFGQAYAMKRAVQIFDKFFEQIDTYKDDIMFCLDYKDIQKALSQHKAAAVLSVEGGDALQGDLSALRVFYKLGVRSICLTWNHRNEIADGVADSITGGGLTPFGREVVNEMNKLGMIIDVSHISEKGFWDVINLSNQPIIASHSNAKKICGHRRNLSDDQIIAIKRNGGVIGINLYPSFLSDTGKASVKDVIKHIEHIAGLVGTEYIGIGADFDGIESTPEDIKGVQDMGLIFNELGKLNYSAEAIENIAGGNFIRVIRDVL